MLLDALGYLGDSLNKPGRAVRGLLGGRPQEALAAIPFSDALGITDQANQVTGHDLLSQLGIDPGDGIGGTLAGMGVDVATDPLTYMGGALAKKLLGAGGAGARAAAAAPTESHIFDLVSPAEREIDKLIPKAAPAAAPAAEAVGAASPRVEAAVPEAAAQAADAMPPGLIDRLPSPREYDFHIGYGHDAINAGLPQDMLMDGINNHDTFKASLAGWDSVLADLERLSPEAGAELGMRDAAGYRPNDYTKLGRQWQSELSNRLADLQVVENLAARGMVPPEIAQFAAEQQKRLAPFATSMHGSSAENALRDLNAGRVSPSRIDSQMEYFAHLPVDRAALKKVAAQGQEGVVGNTLMRALEGLDDAAGMDNATLQAILGSQFPHPNIVANDLLAFHPTSPRYDGLEPSVVRAALARQPDNLRFDPRELLAAIQRLRTGS